MLFVQSAPVHILMGMAWKLRTHFKVGAGRVLLKDNIADARTLAWLRGSEVSHWRLVCFGLQLTSIGYLRDLDWRARHSPRPKRRVIWHVDDVDVRRLMGDLLPAHYLLLRVLFSYFRNGHSKSAHVFRL